MNLRIPNPLNIRLATTVSNANVSQAAGNRGGTPIVTPRVPLMVTAGQVGWREWEAKLGEECAEREGEGWREKRFGGASSRP